MYGICNGIVRTFENSNSSCKYGERVRKNDYLQYVKGL
jgi:hypothetical protein